MTGCTLFVINCRYARARPLKSRSRAWNSFEPTNCLLLPKKQILFIPICDANWKNVSVIRTHVSRSSFFVFDVVIFRHRRHFPSSSSYSVIVIIFRYILPFFVEFCCRGILLGIDSFFYVYRLRFACIKIPFLILFLSMLCLQYPAMYLVKSTVLCIPSISS